MPISKRRVAEQNPSLREGLRFRPVARDPRRTDWDGAVEDFLTAKRADGRSPATLLNYRQFLAGGPTMEFLGAQDPPVTDVRQLTAEMVTALKDQLRTMVEVQPDGSLIQAGRSSSYIDTFHRILHNFHGWCERTGRIEGRSPLRELEYPREDPNSLEIRILSDREIQAILGACPSPRDRFLVRWFLRTGARLSEANVPKERALMEDDLAGPKAMLYRAKVKKWTPVPLDTAAVKFSKEVRDYLTRVRPRDDDGVDALFLTDRRYPAGRGQLSYRALSTNGIKEVIERIWRTSGVEECHAHLFRHRWATDMIRGGMSPTVLQKIGGWTDYRMVNRYVHLVAADLIDAASRVRA